MSIQPPVDRWITLLPLVLSLACRPSSAPGSADEPGDSTTKTAVSRPSGAASGPKTTVQRLDPRMDGLVSASATFEVIAEGFHWLEGPVWCPGDGQLLFSDIPANRIFAWSRSDGVRLFRDRSGYSGAAPFEGREPGSNGLTIDAEGRLLICQHGDRRLVRLERDGAVTVLASHFRGRRLNSPNDVIVHSSGAMYFTDPPFGLPKAFDDPARELLISGVYRVTEGSSPQRVVDDLKAPNGLALSPDERTLYVSDVDPARPAWWSYDVNADGTLGSGRIFKDAKPLMVGRRGGPDGIEVDADGHLFAAGPEGVYIFTAQGEHLGTLLTGVPTANLEWGEDGHTLFVAADTRILRMVVKTRGARKPGVRWSGDRVAR